LVLVSYFIYNIFFRPSPISKLAKQHKLPIVGARKGDWFPYTQAKWRNFGNFKAAALEADKVSREHNTAVLFPVLGTPNLVHLPRSEIQFVTDQPDSVLDAHAQAVESLQIDYTVSDPHLVHHPLHHKLITTTLTSQIGNLVPDVADETDWAFNHHWGRPSEFDEVVVYETLRHVIGGVTNRVFVGAPLCRNQDLLEVGMSYANFVPLTSQFLRLVWGPIKPLVAFFATMPAHKKFGQFEKLLLPEINKRLADYDARQQDPEKFKGAEKEKNDFLQWCIKQAKESGDPYLYKTSSLAGRVLLLNFAAIHTSSFSITHALLDIAYASDRDEILAELRAEIASCLEEFGNKDGDLKWNKQALNKMHKLDSLFRESARLNSFVTIGLARTVRSPMTTPHTKITIPTGATVIVPSYPVMHSADHFDDPETFKPFRFADQRADEKTEYVKRAGKAFASTSSDYLAFGHGKNACPGRFFAANELKLMLAYVVVTYDIEPVKGATERPSDQWFGINRVPDFGAKIRVRVRKA